MVFTCVVRVLEHWSINMVKFAMLDSYRRMRLWINDMPEESNNMVSNKILEYNANNNIHWFKGIICLELRIAPRAASNYAMLNLKFTESQCSKFQVKYDLSNSEEIVKSDIAMKGDTIRTDIVKKYDSAMTQVFNELDSQNIFPSGTLEILGGRHGSIGSSNMAVKIVLKNLLKLFELNEQLNTSDINSLILKGCK